MDKEIEEQVCYVCGEPVCAACEETEDEETET